MDPRHQLVVNDVMLCCFMIVSKGILFYQVYRRKDTTGISVRTQQMELVMCARLWSVCVVPFPFIYVGATMGILKVLLDNKDSAIARSENTSGEEANETTTTNRLAQRIDRSSYFQWWAILVVVIPLSIIGRGWTQEDCVAWRQEKYRDYGHCHDDWMIFWSFSLTLHAVSVLPQIVVHNKIRSTMPAGVKIYMLTASLYPIACMIFCSSIFVDDVVVGGQIFWWPFVLAGAQAVFFFPFWAIEIGNCFSVEENLCTECCNQCFSLYLGCIGGFLSNLSLLFRNPSAGGDNDGLSLTQLFETAMEDNVEDSAEEPNNTAGEYQDIDIAEESGSDNDDGYANETSSLLQSYQRMQVV